MANIDASKLEIFGFSDYNRPLKCKECGGVMVFKGCGEYQCEECRNRDYDDYGKVRNYLEKNQGATMAQAAEKTGVSQKAIRQMLKESRLEVASDSKMFLTCEICGVSIRHGKLCPNCEMAYHRRTETEERAKHQMSGFSMEREKSDSGEKRFHRTR